MRGPTQTLRYRVRRCSRPLCSSQRTTRHPPHVPTRPRTRSERYEEQGGPEPRSQSPPPGWPALSGPNSVPTTTTPQRLRSTPRGAVLTSFTFKLYRIVNVPPMSNRARHALAVGYVLLRKEVIQPHLPVRLPCYDFVPIASPTFDDSLPQGVGPPASGVTDFRDVTGGVYKARERIHRSTADLRLLATPTSWGRVADPNPN